jgi:type II secretory ATPase GspE/PulE/Tfp pilus assembly ATPase PilB-like protein
MVGEIRDIETAELAVQAALTGHLVLGTLHTNDAPTALMRLVDMGLPPYLVNATVNGIVAQRLMRRICTMCKEEHDFAAEAGERALPEELEGVKLFRGKGCNDCRGTGYRGRVAIYELMPVSKALRALVLEGKDADLISSQVRREGMLTLRDEAVRKIRKGETTVQEMWRVTLDEG